MSVDDLRLMLIQLENNSFITYFNLASFAMLLYDHALTLGVEVELIWPRPWSLGKVLFFATKYFALVEGALLVYPPIAPSPIPVVTCTRIFTITGWLIVWGMFIAELVVIFRTWAIWGRKRNMAIGLFLLLTPLTLLACILTYSALHHVEFGPSPSSRMESCWFTEYIGKIVFVDFIMVGAFESVILALTVYKGVQHLRNKSSNLAATLYRDGVLYYIYLLGFSLINIIILATNEGSGPSLIMMQRVMHSILTARILLNLREAASQDRAKEAVKSNSKDSMLEADEMGQSSTWTALSSVVIGWTRGLLTARVVHSVQ